EQLTPYPRVDALGAELREPEYPTRHVLAPGPVAQRFGRTRHAPDRAEVESDEFILERHDRLRCTRVALASAATVKLAVDARRLVQLGGDHVQPTFSRDARTEDDVGAA